MTDVVELLRDLIRFDTTNPPGNEGECIAHVQRLLNEAGVETRIVASDSARPNLIARIAGAGEAPPLLLYGHVDVVHDRGPAVDAPAVRRRAGRRLVWGRGALDMKGGVAMLVDAFLRAARGELKPRGDLILAVLSDEENGGDFGAKYLVERARRRCSTACATRSASSAARAVRPRRQALLSDPGGREADLLAARRRARARRPRRDRRARQRDRASSARSCASSTPAACRCT